MTSFFPPPLAIPTDKHEWRLIALDDLRTVQTTHRDATWTTTQQSFVQPARCLGPLPAEVQAATVHIGPGTHVAATCIRSIKRTSDKFYCLMVGDVPVPMHAIWAPEVAEKFGLASLDHLEMDEFQMALWQAGVRDFDGLLMELPEADLRRAFTDSNGSVDARLLLSNLIWELYRKGRGLPYSFPLTPRGFVYRPVFTILRRLGLDIAHPGSVVLGTSDVVEAWTAALLERLVSMIGESRLFTYSALGFRDARPHLRRIASRDEVILAVEKESLLSVLDGACHLGVSGMILRGQPSWMETEFFAAKFLARHPRARTVRLLTVVDYDPYGWLLVDAFVTQLQRYGIVVDRVTHLVRPDVLSLEERQKFTYLPSSPSAQARTKAAHWVERGGGMDGEAVCFHANDIYPQTRLIEIISKELS